MATTTTTHHFELTCAFDRHAHLVADDALAAELAAEQGSFPALCGTWWPRRR